MNPTPLCSVTRRQALIRSRRVQTLAWFLSLLILLTAGTSPARAQLAITEAMSSASTNCGGVWAPANADFWELTNFGATNVNLNGYLFCDEDRLFPGSCWPLPNIDIAPGESIVFVRGSTVTPDAAAFRNWWGVANLPARPLQIYFYPSGGFGFDEIDDAVRLWDAQGNVVDQAFFGEARKDKGVTFTYEPDCGRFGAFSGLGEGAFEAATCTDIGSPGFAPLGPVLMRITAQPVSRTIDAGSDVTFSVRSCGLPRARYQWFHNGNEITGAVTEDLILSSVQPAQAGQYTATLDNGLQQITSAMAILTVETTPSAPRLECPLALFCADDSGSCPPRDLAVTEGQTATFTVEVRGYPAPGFQWSWSADGSSFVNLPGETSRTLSVLYVDATKTGFYRVFATNTNGSTNATAALTLQPKPRLIITEAMPEGCAPSDDWWELTNTGDAPVNLCGYRWDDTPGNIGGGPTITNAVVLAPGESVIFLEQGNAAQFRARWGETNLPPGLQFIRYGGNGLSLIDDEINLWNATATADTNWIDSVLFSNAKTGISFWFDKETCWLSEFGVDSIANECGAFPSQDGCEIASPGWTRWTRPSMTSARRNGSAVTLEWRTQPGSTCILQCTDKLEANPGATTWRDLGTYTFNQVTGRAEDNTAGAGGQRFYRVKLLSSANCPCPE